MDNSMQKLAKALERLDIKPGCHACDGRGFIVVRRYLPQLERVALSQPRKCLACSGTGLPQSIAILVERQRRREEVQP